MPIYAKRLEKELKEFGRDPENYKEYKVTKHDSRASVGIKSVVHRATVTGKTANYKTQAQLFNVEFVEPVEVPKPEPEPKKGKKGEEPEEEPKKGKKAKKPEMVISDPYKGDKDYIPIVTGDALKYYRVPTARKNPLHLKCSCPDFRFRFEKQLYDKGGLIGNWKRYTRKTEPPPEGYPYANPDDKLGFCKHIWSLLLFLQNTGFMEE